MSRPQELVIRIRGETGEFVAAIDGAGRQVERFHAAVERAGGSTSATAATLATMGRNSGQAGTQVGALSRQARDAAGEITRLEHHSDLLGDAFRRVGALAAGALSVGALVGQFRAISAEQETLERNLLRTQAVIQATGAAAGFSARQLHEQARELALATLQSTEGVMRAQQVLLSYSNIQEENFTRTIELAADLSTLMGSGLTGAVETLAKALDAPAERLASLTDIGFTFSRQQRDTIKHLVETNRLFEAQKIILDTVAGSFGGLARKEAEGFAGAMDTLGQRVQEARLGLGELWQVNQRSAAIVNTVAGAVAEFTENLESSTSAAEALARVDLGVLNTPLEAAIVLARNVRFVFEGVRREIGGIAAQIGALARLDFAGVRTIGELMRDDAERARLELDLLDRKTLDVAGNDVLEDYARRIRAAAAEVDRLKAALARSGGDVNSREYIALGNAEGELKKLIARYTELAGVVTAAVRPTKALADETPRAARGLAGVGNAGTGAGKGIKNAGDALGDFIKKLERAQKEMHDWAQSAVAASVQHAAGLETTTERMREQLDTLGMSRSELARYNAVKLDAAAAAEAHAAAELEAAAAMLTARRELPEVARAYRQMAAERRRAAAELANQSRLTLEIDSKQGALDAQQAFEQAAQAAQDEWQRTADSIEQSLTDALLRGFEDGKGFAQNFRDTLKNMFRTLVLRPLIQPVMAGVAGTIAGAVSGGGASGAGNIGVSALGSAAGSLFGAGGLSGAMMAGAGWLTGATTLSGSLAAAGSLIGAGGAGITSGLAMGAGALAPIALPLLALGLLSGAFGDKKKPDQRGAVDIDLATGTLTHVGRSQNDAKFSQQNFDAANALGTYALDLTALLRQITGTPIKRDMHVGVGDRTGIRAWLDDPAATRRFDSSDALVDWITDELLAGVIGDLPEKYAAVAASMRGAGDEIMGVFRLMVDDFGVLRSEAENFALAQEKLAKAFADIGMVTPQSVDEFRALAAALDLTTEAGRETYAALAGLAPAFAEIDNALRSQAEGLQRRIYELEGNTAALRQMELDAIYPANRALQERIWALEDAAQAERDTAQEVERGAERARAAMLRAHEDGVNRLRRLAGLLTGTLERMDIGTVEAQRMRLADARAQISTAAAIARASDGRVLPDADAIAPALSRVAEPSAALYASFEDYARDFYTTANDISLLAQLTESQLSVGERTLNWLKERGDVQDDQFMRTYALQESVHALQERAGETLGAHTTILEGMAYSLRLLSKEEQLKIEAKNTEHNQPWDGSPMTIARIEHLSGDWAELLGLSEEAAREIVDLRNAMGFPTQMPHVPHWIKGFANGGFHAGGWRVVGERGRELEYTGPSHIFNRAQVNTLIDLEPLLAELRQLRDDLRAGQAAIATHTQRSARRLDEIAMNAQEVPA